MNSNTITNDELIEKLRQQDEEIRLLFERVNTIYKHRMNQYNAIINDNLISNLKKYGEALENGK